MEWDFKLKLVSLIAWRYVSDIQYWHCVLWHNSFFLLGKTVIYSQRSKKNPRKLNLLESTHFRSKSSLQKHPLWFLSKWFHPFSYRYKITACNFVFTRRMRKFLSLMEWETRQRDILIIICMFFQWVFIVFFSLIARAECDLSLS